MISNLIFKDGTEYKGINFGANVSAAGEVVFSTGMVGYPESLTDPSYKGQILVMTYPIVGNYGVPEKSHWESDKIQVSGLVVSSYVDTPSHFQSKRTLARWFKDENLPLLEVKDTRALAQKLRSQGTMLGKITIEKDIDFYDPSEENLAGLAGTKKVTYFESESRTYKKTGDKNVIIIDCGAKRNIIRCFTKRGVNAIVVPWDFDPFSDLGIKALSKVIGNRKDKLFDAVFISNGPGDPKTAVKTIATIRKSLDNKIPTLGICLGNQLLALAAGGDTYKLKFGHRSQNQPCIMEGSSRCFITTQNHGYAIGDIPAGFKPWFKNANDNTVEGIIHSKLPFMAVQFHPEATPGPRDTEWVFDYFLERITK